MQKLRDPNEVMSFGKPHRPNADTVEANLKAVLCKGIYS